MPLSEQEQRLLEEMERSLYQNDADFVATVSARRGPPNYRLIAVGALLALLGIGAIVTGVVVKLPVVGLLGFIVVLGGALLALSSPRKSSRPADTLDDQPRPSGSGSGSGKATAGGFMDRLNQRWDRRDDDRDH